MLLPEGLFRHFRSSKRVKSPFLWKFSIDVLTNFLVRAYSFSLLKSVENTQKIGHIIAVKFYTLLLLNIITWLRDMNFCIKIDWFYKIKSQQI